MTCAREMVQQAPAVRAHVPQRPKKRSCLPLLAHPSALRSALFTWQLHEHEAYRGDRTKEALLAFADNLAPTAGAPHRKHMHLEAAPKSSGCNLAGAGLEV